MPRTASSSRSERGRTGTGIGCVAASADAGDLDSLLADIRACRRCIEAPLGPPLPHAPRPVLRVSATARILVAGQAPGTRVHASGMPFTDPSGDRLRAWMGVSAETFYDATRIAIVPMGFCFPGQTASGADLPPRRECAQLWRERLLRRLPSIELVLLVGQYAHRWHLPPGLAGRMTETVRRHEEALAPGSSGPRHFPLPHPSWRNNHWIKANPWFAETVLPRLRAEVRRLTETG